jgi:hypothetical protein
MDSQNPPHGIFETVGSTTLGWTQGLLIVIALIVLFLLGFWVFRLNRRKRKARLGLPRNPWDELLIAHSQGTSASASATEHMSALNQALRRSLELNTGRAYTAWTSEEILAEMQKAAFSSDFQRECAQFLKTSDRVLFAFEPWDEEDRRHWNSRIHYWLESLQFGRPL